MLPTPQFCIDVSQLAIGVFKLQSPLPGKPAPNKGSYNCKCLHGMSLYGLVLSCQHMEVSKCIWVFRQTGYGCIVADTTTSLVLWLLT